MCSVPHGIGSQFSTDSTGSEAKLLPTMDDPTALPSAPPQDDSACLCHHYNPRYSRLYSDTSVGSGHHYRECRSISTSASIVTDNSTGGVTDPCPHCAMSIPKTPPPTYDKHHRDPILT